MKLKKLLSFTAAAVVALTALAGAMTVSADTVDSGTCGDLSWTLDSEGVLKFTGQGEMESASVSLAPDDFTSTYTYKTHKEDIKEVIFEEGVASIGYCAFYQMPNLETVVIPSTVKEFTQRKAGTNGYSYAFTECTSLKNLTLSEGMTCIGGYAFQGCTSLESVTIPSTINDWNIYSFYECSSLKNITLSEGLKVIGAAAFAETAVQSLVIPSTIESWNMIQKNDRDLDMSVGFAGLAFSNCKKLSSVVFKEGIKGISNRPFQGCSALKKVVVPSSVTSLLYAFYGCTGLEEAYIEEGSQIYRSDNITDTGSVASGIDCAFSNCTKLKRLEIPESVYIDYTNAGWINKCSSLTDLYIHGKDLKWFPSGNDTSKIHCYFDTATYNNLLKNYDSKRLVNIEDEISVYKDTIQSRLNDAKSYDETKYTPESYGVLKALIEKAEKYGDDSNIMSMEQTASDIRAAIKALEKKPDEPVTDPTSDDKSDSTDNSNNTSDSSNNKPTPPEKTEPTTAKTPVQNNINKPANKVPSTPKVTAQKPAKVKSVKLTAKKKKLNVQWKKVSGATGYEVMYATNNKFTKNKKTVKVKKNKVTLKRLKSKKKYYVKVRAYKKANGDTNYGKWSKVVKKKAK